MYKECKMLLTLVKNPGKINKDSLKDVHYCFRQLLRNSHIIIEDEMLFIASLFGGVLFYCHLQIVPVDLQNILFVAFHTVLSKEHSKD